MNEIAIAQRWEYREPPSAKAYEIYLADIGGGWAVETAYGKIGGNLTKARKFGPSSDYPAAFAAFAAEAKIRVGKQYTQVAGPAILFTEAGPILAGGALGSAPAPVAPVGDNSKVDTGLRAQLLNEIVHAAPVPKESFLQRMIRTAGGYLYGADFHAQQKHNGVRLMVIIDKGEVQAANRKGEARALPPLVAKTLKALFGKFGRTVLDGELVGDIYWVFDLLEFDGHDWRHRAFSDRAMRAELTIRPNADSPVQWTEVATTPAAKLKMLETLVAQYVDANGDPYCAAEGMVFKLRAKAYKAGKPNSGGDQYKLKFWRDVDVVILGQNGNKRSVAMGLYDRRGGTLVGMGNITIPANYDIPKAGQVAKVRFLTVQKGGSLVQPQYEGVRDDKTAKECTQAQLVYWPEMAGVETES